MIVRIVGIKKLVVFIDPRTAACEKRGMPINGHTTGVSVLESDEKRAEKRESRYRNAGRLNAGIKG
jgi:hypothetical protein